METKNTTSVFSRVSSVTDELYYVKPGQYATITYRQLHALELTLSGSFWIAPQRLAELSEEQAAIIREAIRIAEANAVQSIPPRL